MRQVREELARVVLAHRDTRVGGKYLCEWIESTEGVDVETWAAAFTTENVASSEIVLLAWPLMKKERVCVWLPAKDGYVLEKTYGGSINVASDSCRNVVYESPHYNALHLGADALGRATATAPAPTLPPVPSGFRKVPLKSSKLAPAEVDAATIAKNTAVGGRFAALMGDDALERDDGEDVRSGHATGLGLCK